jgi:hypothetical protein
MDWLDHFPLTYATAISREWSDHTPLLLDTGIGLLKPYQFKFELCSLTREGVMEVVRPCVGLWWLAETRKKLRGWSRNGDSVFRKEKKRLSQLLDNLDKAADDNGWSLVDREFYFETKSC